MLSTPGTIFQNPSSKRYKYPALIETSNLTPNSADTSTASSSSSANDSTSSTTPPLSPKAANTALNLLGNKFNKIANFSYSNQMIPKNYYNSENYENYPPQPPASTAMQQQHQQHQQYQQQQHYYGYYNRSSTEPNPLITSQQYDLCQNNENYRQPLSSSNIANLSMSSNSSASLPLKKRRAVPSECKDNAYWEKRRKNNESAKRSRDSKRGKEDTLIMRNMYLEQENLQLKTQIAMYETQIENLSRLAHGLGGHLINSSSNNN
jgi:hypothetical protein